jgi:hypothetical protein
MTSKAIALTNKGKKAFSKLDIPIIVPGVIVGIGTTAGILANTLLMILLTDRRGLDLALNNCGVGIGSRLRLSIGIRDDRLTKVRKAIA